MSKKSSSRSRHSTKKPTTHSSNTDPPTTSASEVAQCMLKFQKRREKALEKIDKLVAEIDEIDEEITTYLRDVPVLL